MTRKKRKEGERNISQTWRQETETDEFSWKITIVDGEKSGPPNGIKVKFGD